MPFFIFIFWKRDKKAWIWIRRETARTNEGGESNALFVLKQKHDVHQVCSPLKVVFCLVAEFVFLTFKWRSLFDGETRSSASVKVCSPLKVVRLKPFHISRTLSCREICSPLRQVAKFIHPLKSLFDWNPKHKERVSYSTIEITITCSIVP